MIGVYLIKHVPTEKVYVGASIDIERRWKRHKNELCRGAHGNKSLQKAWEKFGEGEFSFEVVQKEPADLTEAEQAWMDKLDAANPDCGFNRCHIAGPSGLGLLPKTDEHRSKLGAVHKGRKRSDETRKKISDAASGKKRGPLTDEVKRRISNSLKGRPMSESAKAKLSATKTGVKTGPCSDARREAISKAKRARDAEAKKVLK